MYFIGSFADFVFCAQRPVATVRLALKKSAKRAIR
jgi:hypothetical protein